MTSTLEAAVDDQVTLAAYADEVRELIHHERDDEAIAICKHILHYYPQCLDAYRQMGRAYLNKGDYENAKDLFRRVLSADPESLAAYAGLAVIFEQAHLINEAIWHMERAYELAPGNAELQKELLRLYQGENKSHTRVTLTPSALARIYARAGLLSQAIQEFRAIIASAPSRFDVRVALAEALWHTGRIREAADVAQNILHQLQYCLKANLILGTAWRETGLVESDTYLQRAQLLDPTSLTAIELFGTRSPLPAAQPTIPRYIPGAPVHGVSTRIEPGPTESGLGKELSTTPETETPKLGSSAEEITVPPPDEETRTPTGETELPTVSAQQVVIDTDLPDWLRSPGSPLSELSTAGAQASSAPTETTEESATWLADLTGASTSQMGEVRPEATELETSLPSWVSDQPTIGQESPQPARGTAEEMPSWLSEASQPGSEAISAPLETEQKLETAETPSEELLPGEQPQVGKALRETEATGEVYQEVVAEPATQATTPVESVSPIVVEMPSAPSPQSVAAPEPQRKRQPKGYGRLMQAREYRNANRLSDALGEYDYLVQHAPRLISDVIDDLEVLTQKIDAPLEAHRILGDAYTRANRLAEALERYRFVLEHVPK